MFVLDQSDIDKIIQAFFSSYYAEWTLSFKEFLQLSRRRDIRNHPMSLLRLQKDIASVESKIWPALREGRKRAKDMRAKSLLTYDEERVKHPFL